MFTMKNFFEATALRVCNHKNGIKKFITTTANGDDKSYPLDGIRVLDLTRIGKTAIDSYYFSRYANLWELIKLIDNL